MLRTILSIVVGVILLGLVIALMRVFDWDLGALLNWIWSWITGLIDGIASFFQNNSWFQKAVSTTP